MAFKIKRPDYESQSTEGKLSLLIRYVENLSDEIEFRLDSLSKMQKKIKKMSLGDGKTEQANSERM